MTFYQNYLMCASFFLLHVIVSMKVIFSPNHTLARDVLSFQGALSTILPRLPLALNAKYPVVLVYALTHWLMYLGQPTLVENRVM